MFTSVSCYDGVGFTYPGRGTGLAGRSVLALEEGPDGALWFGRNSGKAARCRDGRLDTFHLAGATSGVNVADIRRDREGKLDSAGPFEGAGDLFSRREGGACDEMRGAR